MRMTFALLTLLACGACMDTRSASLGMDAPSDADEREPGPDDEDAADGAQEPGPDEEADAAMPSEPEQDEVDGSAAESLHDAASAGDAGGGAVRDGEAESEPTRRDASVRDGGRDAGYTNPICRIEPWHCA